MRRNHIALGRTTAIAAVAAGTLSAACSASGPTDRAAGATDAANSTDTAAPLDAGGPDGAESASDAQATMPPASDASPTAAPSTTLANAPETADAGRSHGSPSIVVGGRSAIVAFDDSDEDLTTHAIGWARSTDACSSFTDNGAFPDPTPTGVDDVGYPVVGRDTILGSVYAVSDGRIVGTSNYGALAFFVSEDNGATFHPAINAADPNMFGGDYADTPAIAVDNTEGHWQSLVYIAYADVAGGVGPVKLRLSTWAENAFAITEVVSPPNTGDEAALPSVAVAPDESVTIAYYSQLAGQPGIAVIRSTDEGAHFASPVAVAALHTTVNTSSLYGGLGLLGVGPSGSPAPVDVYPSPAIAINPVSGAIYVAFVDAAVSDKANVYFVHSEDSGTTWSSPVRVNDDSTSNDQFLPAIAVTPDGTRLAVDFYDRRNDARNLWAERYGAIATISGGTVTFGPNFAVSQAGFPVTVGVDPSFQPTYFSIHTGMATDGVTFYDAYADTLGGELDVRVARYGVLYPSP